MKSQFYTTSHTRTAAGRPLTPSESAASTCKQTRSRLDAGRSPEGGTHPSVHETRGNHHPFSTFPHARCCAAGQSSRGRSRPGKVRRHWRRGGRSAPVPRTRHSFPILPEAPGQSTPGPPAPLSGQRGPTYSATILLGTFGGPPRQNYTTFREILDFPSRHQMARIQRGGQI